MRTKLLLSVLFAGLSVAVSGCGPSPANSNANAANVQVATETTAPALDLATVTDPAIALAEGDRLLDNNETEKAIDAFKRAAELNPEYGDAYFRMGIAYALLEQERKHSGTSDVLPGDVTSKKDVEQTDSQKMFRKAADAYEKYLKSHDEDAAAYYNLGRALNKLNEDKDAEEALAKAVKLKGDEPEYLTELGAIRIKLAQYHEALQPLRKALELDPDNPDALDLQDEAEAGAKRVDYGVDQMKDKAGANTADRQKQSKGDANTDDASGDDETKPQSTAPSANKPQSKPASKPASTPANPGGDRPRIAPTGKKG